MPLEQPGLVGRRLFRLGRTFATSNPLLRILPDVGPESGQDPPFSPAKNLLGNRTSVTISCPEGGPFLHEGHKPGVVADELS